MPSQEQDGRRLAGVIGGLPVPGAGRIGGAEGCLHGVAQDGGVDAPSPFEIGQKLPRSLARRRRCRRRTRARRGRGGRRARRFVMKGFLGRAGTGRTARRSLWTAAGSNPSRPASRSRHAAGRRVRVPDRSGAVTSGAALQISVMPASEGEIVGTRRLGWRSETENWRPAGSAARRTELTRCARPDRSRYGWNAPECGRRRYGRVAPEAAVPERSFERVSSIRSTTFDGSD